MRRGAIVRQSLDCTCDQYIEPCGYLFSSESSNKSFAHETHLSCSKNRNDVAKIDMIIMQPFVTAEGQLLTTFALVKKKHYLAESSNSSISDKSFLVQVRYFNDVREQERSRTDLGVFQQLQLFIIVSFWRRVFYDLTSNLTKVKQPSVQEPKECHTSRSFCFSHFSTTLRHFTTALSTLHFQLFLCVRNSGNFQPAVWCFEIHRGF